MAAETYKLTVRLPAEEVSFIRDYAKRHGITVTEVIHRYFKRLQVSAQHTVHPDVAALAGAIAPDIDAGAEYRRHVSDKHR